MKKKGCTGRPYHKCPLRSMLLEIVERYGSYGKEGKIIASFV